MKQECMNGTVGGRLGCILSYDGSKPDIIINYLLLLINLIWCVVAFRFHSQQEPERASKLRLFAIFSLVGVVAFQIGICWILGCMGISLIWCATAGWMASERQRLKEREELNVTTLRWSQVELFVIVLDTGAIVYYAFVSEAITTVAHICALILGAMLSMISIRMYDEVESQYAIAPLIESE